MFDFHSRNKEKKKKNSGKGSAVKKIVFSLQKDFKSFPGREKSDSDFPEKKDEVKKQKKEEKIYQQFKRV